jgi:CheY-like chemotaxis protein/HPt (histidine-containing phosphotransfer) domain-containing protein
MPRIVHPSHRVLVIDDGPLNQRLMSGLLEQLGCVVDTASSGDVALAMTAEVPYDVVFVDLHMPGMDGQETIARLRAAAYNQRAPTPLVVVLTADDAPPAGDQDWFDLFLSKPISSALLRTAFDVLATRADCQPTLLATNPAVDLVDEFLEATSDALERMRKALAKGDFEAIASTAHGVKGTGSSFGFRMMSVLGAGLEQDARAGSRLGVERGLLELEQSLSLV